MKGHPAVHATVQATLREIRYILIGATTIFSLQSRPPHSLSTSHEPLLSARAGVFEELERGERLIAD